MAANSISTIGREPAIAAPRPAPTKPASEIGVLRMRSGPNLPTSPLVTPKVPATTSSPMRKTLSSRVISSSMACWRAWMYVVLRAMSMLLRGVGRPGDGGRVQELQGLLGGRLRRLLGEVGRPVHLL